MDEHPPGRPAMDADNDRNTSCSHAVVGYKKRRRRDGFTANHPTNDNATDRQWRRQGIEGLPTMVLGIMAMATFSSVVEGASFCDLGICGPGQAVEFPERLFSYTESDNGNGDSIGDGETFTMSCAEAQDLVDRGPDDDADGTLPIYCDKTTPCSAAFSNSFCNYDELTSGFCESCERLTTTTTFSLEGSGETTVGLWHACDQDGLSFEGSNDCYQQCFALDPNPNTCLSDTHYGSYYPSSRTVATSTNTADSGTNSAAAAASGQTRALESFLECLACPNFYDGCMEAVFPVECRRTCFYNEYSSSGINFCHDAEAMSAQYCCQGIDQCQLGRTINGCDLTADSSSGSGWINPNATVSIPDHDWNAVLGPQKRANINRKKKEEERQRTELKGNPDKWSLVPQMRTPGQLRVCAG